MVKAAKPQVWIRLIGIYAFFNFAYMSFFPFETMYLTGLGYESASIAVLSTVTAIGNFMFQFPVVRFLAKQKKEGQILSAFLTLSIPAAFLLLLFHRTLTAVIFFVFPVTLLDFSCIGQLDGYTVALSRKYPEIRYSITRASGSVAGAAASLILGYVYAGIGIHWMFAVHGAFQCGALLLMIMMKKDMPEHPREDEAIPYGKYSEERKGAIRANFPFIVGGSIVFLGWRAIFVYLPLMLENMGGDSSDQGLALAVINLSSVFVMFFYPFIRKKVSLEIVITAGSTAMMLRWILTAMAGTSAILIGAQVLESFSCGFMHPAMIELISVSAADGKSSSAISIWTGTQMALGTVLANIIVQTVSRFISIQKSFFVFAACSLTGMLVLLISMQKYKQ